MDRKPWLIFQDYIASKIKIIDQYARSTIGSGNKNEAGDVKSSIGVLWECKLRNTKSVTINIDFWNQLKSEIPLHSKTIPVLALQNIEGKRWAVLELDDFIEIYTEYYKMKNGVTDNG